VLRAAGPHSSARAVCCFKPGRQGRQRFGPGAWLAGPADPGVAPTVPAGAAAPVGKSADPVADPLTDARALPGGGTVSFGAVIKLKMVMQVTKPCP